jgi:hypothetical protein
MMAMEVECPRRIITTLHTIREMSLALESVCNAIGVAPEDQAVRRMVAEKIIELAGHGMRGATLHAIAAKAVEINVQKERK